MTNASLFNGTWFSEAESLKPLISAFKTAYNLGKYYEELAALREYFANLNEQIYFYLNGDISNEKLKTEINA